MRSKSDVSHRLAKRPEETGQGTFVLRGSSEQDRISGGSLTMSYGGSLTAGGGRTRSWIINDKFRAGARSRIRAIHVCCVRTSNDNGIVDRQRSTLP
jgi:hypothetical protein